MGAKFLENKYCEGNSKIKGRDFLYSGSLLYSSLAMSIPLQEYLNSIL